MPIEVLGKNKMYFVCLGAGHIAASFSKCVMELLENLINWNGTVVENSSNIFTLCPAVLVCVCLVFLSVGTLHKYLDERTQIPFRMIMIILPNFTIVDVIFHR